MKCIILAAGYATRLYPLTKDFPKPLLKVGGKPILDWLVDDINGFEYVIGHDDDCNVANGVAPRTEPAVSTVDEYIVVSNHRFANHFEEWAEAKSARDGVRITVVDDGTSTNETRLGAVRDIQFAIEKTDLLSDPGSSDGVLVIAGDNVLDFSLQSFLEYSLTKGTSCVMRYYEDNEEKLHKVGVASVNADDLITEMEEKPAVPKDNWCCPPFYYYTHADAALIEKGIAAGCGTDAPGSYIAWLCGEVPVHAFLMPGKRYDVGNLENYEKISKEYKGKTLVPDPVNKV